MAYGLWLMAYGLSSIDIKKPTQGRFLIKDN
jgi:hypothetical protein